MSENKVPLVLTGEELIKALRCCVTNANQGGGCRNCPMQKWSGKVDCDEQICLMAADRIGELMEENRTLRSATENLCQRHSQELIRLAGEMNTALDRGLHGVNEELFRQMQKHQEELVELGRKSVIHVDPAGEKGWRVLGVEVESVSVFAGDRPKVCGPAADPSDPLARATSPTRRAGEALGGEAGGPGG